MSMSVNLSIYLMRINVVYFQIDSANKLGHKEQNWILIHLDVTSIWTKYIRVISCIIMPSSAVSDEDYQLTPKMGKSVANCFTLVLFSYCFTAIQAAANN